MQAFVTPFFVSLIRRLCWHSKVGYLWLVMMVPARAAEGAGWEEADPHHPPLTTAAAVHQLTPSVAEGRLKVELLGTVTHYAWEEGHSLFVQDETDGIFVRILSGRPDLRPGDQVRLRGASGPGEYAPLVRLGRVEKRGSGPLPEAALVTAEALASGRMDCRRVALRGVVRVAHRSEAGLPSRLRLSVWQGGREVMANVYKSDRMPESLEDAEVMVRGVATGVFSVQRQMLMPALLVVDDADLEVLSPAVPFAELPLRGVAALLRYDPGGFPQRRVRLAGTVLGLLPGGGMAVRDDTGGMLVEARLAPTPLLTAGDQVELAGFPEIREQNLWLAQAEVRRTGPGQAPVPVKTDAAGALRLPLSLVSLEGLLTETPRPVEGGWGLRMESGGQAFEVVAPPSGEGEVLGWRAGATLEVTGIAMPQFAPSQRLEHSPFPQALRLLAREIGDVRVLASPPWWTSPRLARRTALGLLATVLLLAAATLAALSLARKNRALRETRLALSRARDELAARYAERTGQWREQVAARHAAEADMTLLATERTRLARELHDTLEQSLASVALQLDAAGAWLKNDPAQADRFFTSAASQLRASQQEVRRSVWGLRSLALEGVSLGEALRQLAGSLADGHGPTLAVTVRGEADDLPVGMAGQLFRIAQEGVTNALKHAGANKIHLLLDQTDLGEVTLEVKDDGAGFSPEESAEGPPRFGLAGMRERVAALEGSLEIHSKPGHGTRVTVRAPLPGRPLVTTPPISS